MHSERIGLTFAQAEGAEPLPSQLELKIISAELSAGLWAVIYASLDSNIALSSGLYAEYYMKDPWNSMMRAWWITREHKNIDEFPPAMSVMEIVKRIITGRNYIKVFDFIQFIIQRSDVPNSLPRSIDAVLQHTRAAYRIIDKHVLPISSDAEVEAVRNALSVAVSNDAKGPISHLRNAARSLSTAEWPEAIRESIHAVEAAAKSIEPAASTLGPALTKLQSSISLNPAMSKAYGALYGYASDQKGIRHALVF